MEELKTKILEYLATHGLHILAAILIFIVGRWVAKILSSTIEKMMIKARIDLTLAKFTRQLMYFFLLTFVIISALARLGVPTNQFVVALGAAGLAIGFALQGSLANFAAGILMIVFKPFKVGDYVEIAGKQGHVEEIQIFNTIINTLDNIKVILPNDKITSDVIMNFTAHGNRRIDLVIGVSYGDDLKKSKQVIMDVLKSDSRVLPEPEPMVAVSELGDSSVNFVVRPWVKTNDYWPVYFDVTEKIKVALEANGITIPFPQRDVHLIKED